MPYFFINTKRLGKLKTIMQIYLFYFLSLRLTVMFTLVTDETLQNKQNVLASRAWRAAKEGCRDRYKKKWPSRSKERESSCHFHRDAAQQPWNGEIFEIFDLSPIISHPSSRYDAARVSARGRGVRQTERPLRSFSVNFLLLMKEYASYAKNTQSSALACNVVSNPPD